MNVKEFWLPYPVATYAKTEPDFYEGTLKGECNWRGNTWIPSNYMIFHGLMRYGFDKEARELAEKTYALALIQNPETREYYDSQSGNGYGMNPFWGWSSLAYAMPLEYRLHYDPTNIAGKIALILTEKLGIRFPAFGQPDMPGGATANADFRAGTHDLETMQGIRRWQMRSILLYSGRDSLVDFPRRKSELCRCDRFVSDDKERPD